MSYRLEPGQDLRTATAVIDAQRERNAAGKSGRAYSYPKSAQEWWDVVNAWWPDLLAIAYRYGGLTEIDARSAEPLSLVLERWRAAKDAKLAAFLERVWNAAPDHGSIHANLGWDVLCDLCSEAYVLEPKSQPEAAATGNGVAAGGAA